MLGPAVAASDSEEGQGGAQRGTQHARLVRHRPGTNEIQRNIIGERVLGLPKDLGVDRSTPFNQLRVGTMRKD